MLNAFELRNTQLEDRKRELSDVVDMSMSTIADYARQSDAGTLTIDEARRQAIARISAQRYGASGYVTIMSSDSVVGRPPRKPDTG